MEPEWVVGVGGFARRRAEEAFKGVGVKVAGILHPSPANPAANRNWAERATAQLRTLGIW
jgi:single-strand selective monofunctional uracil DNA glycosylase